MSAQDGMARCIRGLWLAILPLAVACTAAQPTLPGGRNELVETDRSPQKAIVIALSYEPATLEPSFGSGSGNRDMSALFSGFLAYLTPDQQPMPYLAEELPSLEKGTWKVLPDGTAETTYRLKKQARWHDGQPVTAHDYAFAHQMHLDPAMPTTKIDVDRRMAAVRPIDDQVLFIQWKEPYLWAGMVHGPNFPALPKHLLEEQYLADKAAFANGLHWSREFVGNGPYRLDRWEQGVEMTLRAHDGFALGKPPIDQIVLKFIPDANAIVANLLSGTVDAAFHSSISFAQNSALEQARWQGTTEYWPGSAHYLEFQTRDWGNLQRAVLDVRVRRALLHAIDRHAIVDGLYAGKASVLHFWLSDDDAAYRAADRAVLKYEHDVGRARALLSEAGWIRSSDGQFRDPSGEALHVPLISQNEDIDQQQATIVADNWKTLGVSPEVRVMSPGQQRDNEYRTKIPAVAYNNRPMGYDTMVWLNPQVPMPENRWRGNNYSGYFNPVLEELWPKVLATIDNSAREALIVEALSAMTADAIINPLHYRPRAMAYRAGLVGPQQPWVGEAALIWNFWEWHWR